MGRMTVNTNLAMNSILPSVLVSVSTRFSYSAAIRYRTTQNDRRFGFDVPNTGGEWLEFVPAVGYAITDKFNIGVSGRIPIARNLNGTLQFTTSYAYALSLSYAF